MNWLRRKIVRWLDDSERTEITQDCVVGFAIGESIDMERAIRFNVLQCQGGVVVESRTLNHTQRHQTDNRTFIIPEGDDIAAKVGQIVAMELLRS
jgi:hypothetical protein